MGRFYSPADETPALPVAAGPHVAESREGHAGGDLPSIVGLDAEDGLSRVAGNRKLYWKLLRQFSAEQGAVVEEITGALARGDRALAERLAHTLKGVAGNIGARPVQAAAGALEKLIRNGADGAAMESARHELTAALGPLVAQLRATLSSTSPESPAEATPPETLNAAECREAAAQLTRLLSESDPGAADFVEANRSALRPLFAGEAWTRFESRVEGYSFAEAQAQLEEALQRLSTD